MKKIIIFFTVLLCFPILYCHGAGSARIIMEASTGTILESSNHDAKLPMASTTKIMTAIVCIEHTKPEEKVKITAQSAGTEGSSMYLKTDEIITVENLLYGLMLVSGNDAANALAIHVGGSIEKFADMMNQKAEELGLTNTRFENPSGLYSEGHYTSAHDLAKLTAYALKNETFAKIVATKSYTADGRTLVNHNRLLRELDGCIGVKTGYTRDCGRCLVSAVKRDNVTLICVTLNCPDDWRTHKTLYENNFKRCSYKRLVREKEIYNAVSVAGGHNAGYYCPDISGVVIDGKENISVRIHVPSFIYAPKTAGQNIGIVEVYNNDIKTAQADLFLDRNTRLIPRKKSKIRKFFDFILHKFGF